MKLLSFDCLLTLLLCISQVGGMLNRNPAHEHSKCIVDCLEGEEAYLLGNVCFNDSFIIFSTSSLGLENKTDEELLHINSCLLDGENTCDLHLPLVRSRYSNFTIRTIVRDSEIDAQEPIRHNGPWFYGDTTLFFVQFGHVASKLMQFFSLSVQSKLCLSQLGNDFATDARMKYLSIFQTVEELNNLPTQLEWISKKALGFSVEEMVSQGRLADSGCYGKHSPRNKRVLWPNLTCFENTMFLRSNEKMFVTPAVGASWSKIMADEFKAIDSADVCKIPRVVVMQRKEGSGLRKFLNYPAIEVVLKKHGIHTYENVTLHARSSLTEVAGLFRNFTLMLTSHSSQMKNLVFARNGSAVVELRAESVQPFRNVRDPFGWESGVQNIGVIYKNVVWGNTAGPGHVSDIRSDVLVNETAFDEALTEVLAQQRRVCPKLVYV